jgi:hypothetical protein
MNFYRHATIIEIRIRLSDLNNQRLLKIDVAV